MKIAKESWNWIREPAEYRIEENRIEIVTKPHTDLWQRTYYHFRNDNAPVLQWESDERFFSFTVKADYSGSRHRFDQCGIARANEWISHAAGSVLQMRIYL